MFVDCYSRYTILVPSSNHTASTVSGTLLRHIVPYFGTPRRLLSDCGREFVGDVWGKLMRSLGIQCVLTSPYHPEGNAINECSHRTLNNMLRARLLEGTSSKAWVEKVPGIMLSLNAMSHEPHGFSASMVATSREPTLPPDVQHNAHASPSVDDPTNYVEVLTQRLKLTHQQMATPPPPAVVNPYQEGSLIYAMTTPPERSSKLTPRWKGPFHVKRVPNNYQVVYEDGSMWRTVYANHTKPVKFAVPDLPEPTPAPETPRPAFGYLPSGLLGSRPQPPPPPPPPAAAPVEGRSISPTASVPTRRPSAPTASEMPPPATAPANQNSEPSSRPQRSPRLNPELDRVCGIKGPPGTLAPQSQNSLRMARTYPLFVSYNQCLGAKEDPLSFASLCLEDLRNGRTEYLSTLKQLMDALPKTENPTSRFALHGHVTHPGQQRLRHSMRAALWWLLPSNGEFCRASHSLQYYLTPQGRHVVLRGGDVTRPFYKNCLNWVPDPMPPAPRRLNDLTSSVPASTSSVPASAINTPPSEARPRLPRRLRPRRRRKRQPAAAANKNSASRKIGLMTPLEPSANDNLSRWASSAATRPRSTANEIPGFQPGTRSALEKHPQSFTSSELSQHPVPAANQNRDRPFCLDHPEIRGVYRPARIDPRQDSTANRQRDNFSGFGLSSPALQQPPTKPFSGSPSRHLMTDPLREARDTGRQRPGIVYPLPRTARSDTRLSIDAALPEAAAVSRGDRPPTVVDIPEPGRVEGTRLPGPSQPRKSRSPRRHSRKRPRNRSTGVYRPKKRSPHLGHWCE